MLDATVRQWHRITIGTPDVFELVERMIVVHDEPVATATWLSHFLLCEEAARLGFSGMFGGLGGDELNAGEYEHFLYFFADLRTAGRETLLAHEIECWALHHDHPVFRKSAEVAVRELARVIDPYHRGQCLVDRQRMTRYADALAPDYFDLRTFEPVMEHLFASYLKNRTYQDLTRETLPCCLRAEDRHTVAFGLQKFLPFLQVGASPETPKKVINIASIDGIQKINPAYNYAYGISKAGVIQLGRHLGDRLAWEGIQLNTISPGDFPTDLNTTARDHTVEMKEETPAKRIGEKDNVAGAAIFLASRAGNFSLGSNIIIDGGASVRGIQRDFYTKIWPDMVSLDKSFRGSRYCSTCSRRPERAEAAAARHRATAFLPDGQIVPLLGDIVDGPIPPPPA